MICKWCGARLSAGEVCCRTCGRDTPPMSECGGFTEFPGRNAGQNPGVQAEMAGLRHELQLLSARSKKPNAGMLAAVIAVFFITVILFAILQIQTGMLRAQVEDLTQQAEALTEASAVEEDGEAAVDHVPDEAPAESVSGEKSAEPVPPDPA